MASSYFYSYILKPFRRLILTAVFLLAFVALSSAVYAAIVIDLDNDEGDFSDYTATVTDGGDLAVSAAAGLAGTSYGLSVTVDDDTLIYGYKALSSPSTTGVTRARFYINANTLNLDPLEQVSLVYLINTLSNSFGSMKLMNISGTYYLRGVMLDDSGVHQETPPWPITAGEHYAEFKITRASSANANDATYEAWIDGVAVTGMTGVDSYDRSFNFNVIAGGLMGVAGTVTGTYYLDEIAVNTDGAAIGPVATPTPSPTPTATPTPSSSSSNASTSSNGSNINTSTACTDQPPGSKTPWLYSVEVVSATSLRLYFTEADSPVTKYVLQFGTKPGIYEYGVQDLGTNERKQMTFVVESLSPNTNYYFRVRAQNGCTPGDWSNEKSGKTSLARADSLEIINSTPMPTVTTPSFIPISSPSPSVKVDNANINSITDESSLSLKSNLQSLINRITNWFRSLFD